MTTLPLLREVLSPALVRALGYALLHSLWQGGVLALLLAGVLPLLRRQQAEVRYAVAAGALASLGLVVGLTFGRYYQSSARVAGPLTAARAAPASPALGAAGWADSQASVLAARAFVPARRAARAAATPLTWLRANGRQLEAYLPLVVVAWLLGLLLMSGRLAGGLLYASRLRRAGTQALGAEWPRRLAALARRAGVRQPVALLESARVAGPLVLGHLRPVILLPLGAVVGLSPALLEALLAHELAHIVRRDYLLNLGLAVGEVLFFYHPAVWFMAGCLRAERENCCDDQAAALCGGDRLRVARALAALAELEAITGPTPRLTLAAAGAGGRGGLLARVRRLALGRPQAPTRSERLLAGSLTLLGLLGLSTGVVLAARPAQATPSQVAAPAGASSADTTRRRVAVVPAAPQGPVAPPVPAPADTLRQIEKEKSGRAELAAEVAEIAPRQLGRRPPRRGPARTVVIEKDKKGRVVHLTVDGQPIATTPGKKERRGPAVRTVEVVRVLTPPEPPLPPTFNFDFPTDEANAQLAQDAARRALAAAGRDPALTAGQEREIQEAMRHLKLKMRNLRMDRSRQFKDFHFDFNASSAARHAPTPPVLVEIDKRGRSHLHFDKSKIDPAGEAAEQAQREAEQADRAAEQADRDAEQAEQAERAAGQAERDGRPADRAGRRAELRARIAAAKAELAALDGPAGGRPELPPLLPPLPRQAPPAPPAPPTTSANELRAALRRDGLIGKNDRNFSFQLNEQGGQVNGMALTPEQVARYRRLLHQPAAGKGKSTFSIMMNEN